MNFITVNKIPVYYQKVQIDNDLFTEYFLELNTASTVRSFMKLSTPLNFLSISLLDGWILDPSHNRKESLNILHSTLNTLPQNIINGIQKIN